MKRSFMVFGFYENGNGLFKVIALGNNESKNSETMIIYHPVDNEHSILLMNYDEFFNKFKRIER